MRRRARLLIPVLLAPCALWQAPPAQAAPAPNDNYLASTTLASANGRVLRGFRDVADTTAATTQSDLFDPNRDGAPFGGAGPETTTCGTTPLGKTVWYDFAPEVDGGVEIVAGGYDTVVSVYRYDPRTARIAGVVTCRNAGAGEDVLLPRVDRGGSYTIQVGGVGAGAHAAAGILDFSFRFFADRDRDGVLDEEPDHCLTVPGVSAAGGCPPRLGVTSRLAWIGTGGGVRLTRLLVDKVPSGSRIEARCRRCGLNQLIGRSGSRTVHLERFVGSPLPPGATIEVFVTHAASGSGRFRFGAVGSYFRYRVRGNEVGPVTTRCLRPGSRTPREKCR